MTGSPDLSLFSPSFAEHIQQPLHARLYHYTGQEGLLGIVTSGTLWATNIVYLNDATEFHRPLSMLRDRVKEELERREYEAKHFSTRNAAWAGTAEGLASRLKLLRGKLTKVRDTAICVACFCEDGDLLSQWRGYSGRGYGYSLGFKSALLKEKTAGAGFLLGECIYEPERQQKIVDESLEYLLRPSAPDDEKGVVQELLGVLRFLAFFKDRSFRQEQEWRLISGHRVPVNEVKFRSASSMIIPYINIEIGAGKNSFINHVYVGPCPHMDLSIGCVRQLLFQKDITVQVDESAIPFRDW
jgi:hypothetical protein